MEQDILSQIYYGKNVPWERPRRMVPEMEGIRDRISSETAQLERSLDEKGKELLKRLLDDDAELEGRMAFEGFREGFQFGAQVMLAVMGITMP